MDIQNISSPRQTRDLENTVADISKLCGHNKSRAASRTAFEMRNESVTPVGELGATAAKEPKKAKSSKKSYAGLRDGCRGEIQNKSALIGI